MYWKQQTGWAKCQSIFEPKKKQEILLNFIEFFFFCTYLSQEIGGHMHPCTGFLFFSIKTKGENKQENVSQQWGVGSIWQTIGKELVVYQGRQTFSDAVATDGEYKSERIEYLE